MTNSCRRERLLLFILSAVCWDPPTANAFSVVPATRSVSPSAAAVTLHYKHKDNNDDHLFGDSQGEQVPSGLQKRLQDLQRQETRFAAIEGRNWNQANWKVNGIPWNATVTSVWVAHNEDDTPMLLVGDDTGTVSCLQWITNGVPSQSILEEDAPVAYEIVQQWTIGGAVRLLAADEEFVYASDGAAIHQWTWDEDGESNCEPVSTITHPCHTMQAIHDNRLVSVHAQGVHIWREGSLLGEYKMEETIACAAVDDKQVYLGMANGDIVVHSLQQILDGDSSPLARWSGTRNDSMGISALAVGGDTRVGSQMVQVLFAGDTDGGVKQWFLLPQGQDHSLQPWPKLPTQRLPKKAHVFPGHTDRVHNILAVDGVKFVSSSVDATVKGWNAATGKEIFSMEGFPTAVDSLATMDGFLVTNGMGQYLPLNDFTVDDDDFDLDMPEYI